MSGDVDKVQETQVEVAPSKKAFLNPEKFRYIFAVVAAIFIGYYVLDYLSLENQKNRNFIYNLIQKVEDAGGTLSFSELFEEKFDELCILESDYSLPEDAMADAMYFLNSKGVDITKKPKDGSLIFLIINGKTYSSYSYPSYLIRYNRKKYAFDAFNSERRHCTEYSKGFFEINKGSVTPDEIDVSVILKR